MKLEIFDKILVSLFLISSLTGFILLRYVLAEQYEGTPSSGVDSIIKEQYEDIVDLGYGIESGEYPAMWNRIITAGEWVPEGNISTGDVLSGKTFYNNSRTLQTGTLVFPLYADMSLQTIDFRNSNASSTWASWTKTSEDPEIWKDNRTGLYFSPRSGEALSNSFTVSTCPFFSTASRGDYDGSNANCGDAINYCANLSIPTHTGGENRTTWYLPTQAEILQGYLDGIYLSTNPDWVGLISQWSSTESSSLNAIRASLHNGYNTGFNLLKSSSYTVRCVLRD